MKTPKFWADNSILSIILSPLGRLYGGITGLRFALTKPYKAACPVICVGNLTAGGTGKTPVSLALADILQQEGKNPFFLTRGYGGKVKNIIVNPQIHLPQEVGDEPLLLAAQAKVVINPNRAEGAQKAIENGADCLIMDDGFQNPKLHKNLSFLVFDGEYGIGNGKMIPAGPLRESFQQGIKRAQAIIILGQDKHNIASRTTLPVFFGQPEEITPTVTDKNVFAFAGIGRPEKLYQSLKKCGLHIVKTKDFPDHHFYTREELNDLITIARQENLTLYTTSKDFVKIPTDLQSNFNVLKIEIKWKDEDKLKHFINSSLHGKNGYL